MKINTALILCAGLGKRLNPLTLDTPKPLLKLNNITILEKYEKEGSPYYASARLWDDGIISPIETREKLILALESIQHNPIPDTNFPVFRM